MNKEKMNTFQYMKTAPLDNEKELTDKGYDMIYIVSKTLIGQAISILTEMIVNDSINDFEKQTIKSKKQRKKMKKYIFKKELYFKCKHLNYSDEMMMISVINGSNWVTICNNLEVSFFENEDRMGVLHSNNKNYIILKSWCEEIETNV